MPSRSPFYWLPNAFTGLRLVLTVPILWAALADHWLLAFWLLVIALLTDFLDGYAAVKLRAHTHFGEQLDPVADFALAASGMLALIIAGDFPVWAGGIMLVPALAVGYINFFTPKQSGLHRMHHLFSVPYLFAVWTVVAWYFAAQAYGWSAWYVVITLVLLVVAAIPKRHRLRSWFAWASTSRLK
jgi:cardiolipin synthase